MSVAGPALPSTATTAAEIPWLDNDWTTPGNIFTDDGTTANVTGASYDSPDQTYVLKAKGFDFSAIPDGSTINGVTCRVNTWYASGQGSGSLDLCQLLDVSGAKVGTNQCLVPVALTTTTSTIITKGSASDLWGNALTAAWVKDPDFGVALGILATAANADVFIDYVTLEIDYTVAITGTMASTETADSMSASGTVVTAVTGTMAAAGAADSMAASGSEVFTGTLAAVNAGSTMAASGAEVFTGTLTGAGAADSMAASGSVSDPTPPVTGTLAATGANDSLTANGTIIAPIAGTLSAANVGDGMAATGGASLPTFTPPTVKQGIPGDRLFSRYGMQVGQSVVRKNGVFTLDPYPWLGDLTGLVDGTDYFLGGHEYTVTTEIANELTAAGFTVG